MFKKTTKLTFPILLMGLICSQCKNETFPERTLINIPAKVVKGCFDFSRTDSFSIELENYPKGVFDVYPAERIPDEFRINGLEVFISAEISSEKETNQCYVEPNVKLTGTNIIKITNIQKRD